MVTLKTVVVRRNGIFEASVGDEAVLMSVENEQYYALTATSHAIWELLKEPVRVGELFCAKLADAYQMPLETVEPNLSGASRPWSAGSRGARARAGSDRAGAAAGPCGRCVGLPDAGRTLALPLRKRSSRPAGAQHSRRLPRRQAEQPVELPLAAQAERGPLSSRPGRAPVAVPPR